MSKKTFPTVRNATDQFQREAKFKIDEINRSPILDGKLVTVSFEAGVTKPVTHNLGRPYRGWFIVDTTIFTELTRDSSDNNRQAEYVPLQSSEDATLTLWIF